MPPVPSAIRASPPAVYQNAVVFVLRPGLGVAAKASTQFPIQYTTDN
jgi:hypothetical protein